MASPILTYIATSVPQLSLDGLNPLFADWLNKELRKISTKLNGDSAALGDLQTREAALEARVAALEAKAK